MRSEITKYGGLSPVQDFFSEFERLFEDRFFKDPFFVTTTKKRAYPKIDVIENSTEYVVQAAIPGYDKDSVKAEFENDCLHLSADAEDSKLDEDTHYLHREISYKAFHRVIPFEKKVDSSKIKATYENGCLIFKLPKKKVETPVKTIKIE